MMALTSVTAASMMDGASEEYALLVVPFVLRWASCSARSTAS